MESAPASSSMKSLGRSVVTFVACGLLLYAGLYYAAEQLMRSTGRSNAFFKIATMEQPAVDWVILGASHAMPLDFDGFNALMERDTGLRIANLASPGTGPLYNRFVLEHYLREHRTRNLLYVVDSFAFYSRAWNEERFADPKLLARTPRDPAIAARLWQYVRHEGVDPRALLDYATGFSKINNRDRFKTDVWEGEAQFERAWRPSASAVKKRIEYLYPDRTPAAVLDRYMGEFSQLLELARQAGARVTVVKLPAPPGYRSQLPAEAQFDEAILRVSAKHGVAMRDFSTAIAEPRSYFDTDHLNRAGLTEFFNKYLKGLLMDSAPARDDGA
ncbi:MAG TPA: SGNH/GDSL hydrolase family protein [Ramlibacter sp.]|nr:SGNH/GDSL hydrolase family protein [Ramlibacter sp.]